MNVINGNNTKPIDLYIDGDKKEYENLWRNE